MRTLLQINTTLNRGSTGRIAEQIGVTAMTAGWNSFIAHGARYRNPSRLQAIQIDSLWSEWVHCGWRSLLLDRHGLGSTLATKRLIHRIEHEIRPDIIHLHNTHGYYLNYRVLFDYLAKTDIPVVWTLHDCWPFTGHCTHFDLIGCDRWKTGCHDCPQRNAYPSSLFVDRSEENYRLKRRLFTSLAGRLTLVPVSEWLGEIVRQSFIGNCPVRVIRNGVDTGLFKPSDTSEIIARYALGSKWIILGVASPWSDRKGLPDFIGLRSLLSQKDYAIVLVGLSQAQISNLPEGIIGIKQTQNVQELVQWYSAADVFFNPTYEDNFPTVNLEAISCGTPVVTYRTGGSPEAVTSITGSVVEQGNLHEALASLITHCSRNRGIMRMNCRNYAEQHFDKDFCFPKYMELYNEISSK